MARLAAGSTEAGGSSPPRRRTAIVGASIVSGVAVPPWLAWIERAGPRPKGIPAWAQRSARQVPGQETLDGHDKIGALRCHGPEECLRTGLHVLVEQNLASLVQDADLHTTGMPIDAAVYLVLRGVKSPEVSSSEGG